MCCDYNGISGGYKGQCGVEREGERCGVVKWG